MTQTAQPVVPVQPGVIVTQPVGSDMFAGGHQLLVNPINDSGSVVAGGLAGVFFKKYPALALEQSCAVLAGLVTSTQPLFWRDPASGLWICNMLTMGGVGGGSLDRIILGVTTMSIWLMKASVKLGIKNVGVPALGCGVGGLKWDRVEEWLSYMLDPVASIYGVNIYLYPPGDKKLNRDTYGTPTWQAGAGVVGGQGLPGTSQPVAKSDTAGGDAGGD